MVMYYNGSIELDNLTEEQIEKIKTFVNQSFEDLMNLDTNVKILYISGDFDNNTAQVERFVNNIASYLPVDYHSIITVESENKDVKYDLSLKDGKLFVVKYAYSPVEEIQFTVTLT